MIAEPTSEPSSGAMNLAQRNIKDGMRFLRTLTQQELQELLLLNNIEQLAWRTQMVRPKEDRSPGLRSLAVLKRERARILTLLGQTIQ